MRKILTIVAAVLTVAGVLAQDAPKQGKAEGAQPPRHGMRPGMSGRPMQGPMLPSAWVAHALSNQENLDKIGVKDAAVREKLAKELGEIKEKSASLEKQVREISREQAKLMRELFSDRGNDGKSVLDKIDEVAKLRAEQGRLAVKAILVARDNLTEEQLKEAQSVIRENGRQRRFMRRGDDERHRPEGGPRRGPGRRQQKAAAPEE